MKMACFVSTSAWILKMCISHWTWIWLPRMASTCYFSAWSRWFINWCWNSRPNACRNYSCLYDERTFQHLQWQKPPEPTWGSTNLLDASQGGGPSVAVLQWESKPQEESQTTACRRKVPEKWWVADKCELMSTVAHSLGSDTYQLGGAGLKEDCKYVSYPGYTVHEAKQDGVIISKRWSRITEEIEHG